MGKKKNGNQNGNNWNNSSKYCTSCNIPGHDWNSCNKNPNNNRNNNNNNNNNNNSNNNNSNSNNNNNNNNNKNNYNSSQYCQHCKTPGHIWNSCPNKNQNQQHNQQQNQQQNQHQNQFQNQYQNQYHNQNQKINTYDGHQNGFLMNTPFQLGPPELEALWCRWCNSLAHSTLGCPNVARQVEVECLPDVSDNFCGRCGYKAHTSYVCCNPQPHLQCFLCHQKGHSFKNCLRAENPQIRRIIESASVSLSKPENEKNDTKSIEKSAIQSLKRKREAIEETKRACSTFISSLVDATTQKEILETVPVTSDDLCPITNQVMNWRPGDDSVLWNTDMSGTIKSMQMFHLNNNVWFFGIRYALHRLTAGFSIHCAHENCAGSVEIITPDFETVTTNSRKEYDHHQPEHAVFLACNCQHAYPAFKWTRSRTQEADTTTLHLLKQAHSNPIFLQFTKLNAGLSTDDSEVELEASLELEKTRAALAEQQRILKEEEEKLALTTKAVKVKQYVISNLGHVSTAAISPSFGSPMHLDTPFAKKMATGFPPSPINVPQGGLFNGGGGGGAYSADYETQQTNKRYRTDQNYSNYQNDNDRRAGGYNTSQTGFSGPELDTRIPDADGYNTNEQYGNNQNGQVSNTNGNNGEGHNGNDQSGYFQGGNNQTNNRNDSNSQNTNDRGNRGGRGDRGRGRGRVRGRGGQGDRGGRGDYQGGDKQGGNKQQGNDQGGNQRGNKQQGNNQGGNQRGNKGNGRFGNHHVEDNNHGDIL
ncbi:hypothetical protein D6C79_01814 [Aureobasidium pullulans]|nr:hypothetical protein D6C79_01814 [Aureobasidium pullulans]